MLDSIAMSSFYRRCILCSESLGTITQSHIESNLKFLSYQYQSLPSFSNVVDKLKQTNSARLYKINMQESMQYALQRFKQVIYLASAAYGAS